MKKSIVLFLLCALVNGAFCQDSKISSKQLSPQEIDAIFTDSLKEQLDIKFSIDRIYAYDDKGGTHYIILTENQLVCDMGQECFDSIQAFCFNFKEGSYLLEWQLTDFILANRNEVSEEYSINFWTKYFELNDYDYDGLVDPILVYGTYGMNGTDDGRIKLLIYYKGKKRAIRHQNGLHDSERNTQVDEQYYELPTEIKQRVTQIMETITKNAHGIFPYGWQTAMKNKKVRFDEN